MTVLGDNDKKLGTLERTGDAETNTGASEEFLGTWSPEDAAHRTW